MGFLRTLVDQYYEEMERHKNRPFLRGAMAACALVATTDGGVSFSERVRVDQILETLKALRVFDPHVGVNLFNEFTDAILANPAAGHALALSAIEEVARDPDNGALLLRICLAISEADGAMTLADQVEIVSLCNRFGIDPRNCGLYVDDPAKLVGGITET